MNQDDRSSRWRRARRTLAGVVLVLAVGLALVARNPVRTLTTLTRVDDYPLYVMHYHGGYWFGWYLRQGIESPILKRLEAMNPPAGCTTFTARTPQGDVIFGRNFDWRPHPALLLFTHPPGGYASASMVDMHYLGYRGQETSWKQRLLLLLAPYVTVDGMNEHGLAVSMMEVPCRSGPQDAKKTTIVSNHVMRLALDYAKDVEQALDLMQDYNVSFPRACVHYLFADASGRSAVVEYVAGQPVVIRNREPWQVATNFLVSEEQPEGADSSCWRYNGAYETLRAANGRLSSSQAMSLVARASVDNTLWSVVYNLTAGEIQVVVGRHYDRVHTFKLEMHEAETEARAMQDAVRAVDAAHEVTGRSL